VELCRVHNSDDIRVDVSRICPPTFTTILPQIRIVRIEDPVVTPVSERTLATVYKIVHIFRKKLLFIQSQREYEPPSSLRVVRNQASAGAGLFVVPGFGCPNESSSGSATSSVSQKFLRLLLGLRPWLVQLLLTKVKKTEIGQTLLLI
jgi:hypothetical protein